MESTLTSLASWFDAHGLKLNTSKTEILLLGTRQNTRDLSPVSVRVGGGTIRESPCVKNLGVMFDRHLTWDAHVSDVVRRCVGLLIGLRHLRHYLPQHVMMTVVQGLVISRVRYCLSVYGNGSAANDARLMKVLNFANRVVAGFRKFDHVSHAWYRLGLRTPRQMCDLQTYLQRHTQSVSLKDGPGNRVLSRPLPNTMGVFQGSALGPLLFTVFSNDLSLFSGDAAVFQYADDTQLLVSGPQNELGELVSRMEVSLASLDGWFCANALKVNASKTQLLVFGSRQNLQKVPAFTVSLRDTELEPCALVGNLGVVFDGTLSWEAHVAELSRRCTGLLIGLSHIRHYLPDGVIKTLAMALVMTRVQYSSQFMETELKRTSLGSKKILNFAASHFRPPQIRPHLRSARPTRLDVA